MRLDHLLSKVQNLKKVVAKCSWINTVRFSGCTRTLKGEGRKRPRTGHATRGGVAQLVERLPCKQEASGSNPLISTSPRGRRSRDACRTSRERKKSGPGTSGTESRKKLRTGRGATGQQSLFSLSNRKIQKGLIAQLVRARA